MAEFMKMVEEVAAFGRAHDFELNEGYDPLYRIALMSEELGEISECITKGKSDDELNEELADMLILVIGTAIGCELDLNAAFWGKMNSLKNRRSKLVNGRVRMTHDKMDAINERAKNNS